MRHDPTRLIDAAGIGFPLIGFYDAPDPSPFEPLVEPPRGARACVFEFFDRWRAGETLHLTTENYGCGGAGRALCGVEARSREEFVKFLVDQEGLKASRALMEEWIDHNKPYRRTHDHLLLGPLRESQYGHLKSVTFYVNPDQLGLLALGAQYHAAPSDPRPVLAPFGSGCMQLVTLFEDLGAPQAVIGATDIAMRQHLPPDLLAFTATKPLFERLCALDERSFLYKPFWKRLKKAREAG
ncbi:MAG: DUF169 domain-containing protein [Candidatus Eisenbacteria bacterium]